MNATFDRIQTQHASAVVNKQATREDAPEMTVSNFTLDRDGDRINPHGADLSAFRKNGPLLWGHKYDLLPIGKVTHVWVDANDNLRAKWRWLENDEFAARVKNAWAQGVVSAASIGFLPLTKSVNKFGGQDHHTWQLLEISLCSVPSNPDATRALKSLGLLDVRRKGWGDEVLEVPDHLWASLPALVGSLVRDHQHDDVFEISSHEMNAMLRERLPAIVGEAFQEVLESEVETGILRATNRLRGRVD